MKFPIAAAATLALACAAHADQILPMNRPVTVDGIKTACTGIGQTQDEARWLRYPVRVEFTNDKGQWTAGANVTVAKAGGRTLARFRCPANWVLLSSLAPGDYQVTATLAPGPGGTESAQFRPPRSGQKQVVLAFSSPAAD